jgi:hypothetical protein
MAASGFEPRPTANTRECSIHLFSSMKLLCVRITSWEAKYRTPSVDAAHIYVDLLDYSDKKELLHEAKFDTIGEAAKWVEEMVEEKFPKHKVIYI